MNIIFLDIDGVLNNDPFVQATNETICPENVQEFNRIVSATKAAIVLSSSWRLMIGRTDEFCTLSHMERYLRKRGIRGRIIDTTPVLVGQKKLRGQEIKQWLRQHPEVGNYVILDDVTDPFMPSQHTVATDSMAGLTAKDADKAIQLLRSDGEQPRPFFNPYND